MSVTDNEVAEGLDKARAAGFAAGLRQAARVLLEEKRMRPTFWGADSDRTVMDRLAYEVLAQKDDGR